MNAGPTSQTQDLSDETTRRAGDRRALRKRLVKTRRALSAEEVARLSTVICARLASEFAELARLHLAFYWPLQNEADLRPLLARWLSEAQPGFLPLLPVALARESALAFREWNPQAALVADACGILAPAAGIAQLPQALLIPVNGFDAAGYRLGYGGGYFDRTLAAMNPKPLTIGVGFELARVDSIHPEAHDVKLDAIVTEAGVFAAGAPEKG